MLNGALRFTGVAGMKDHYQNKIWPDFDERLNPLRFIGNDAHVAIEMRTEFEALATRPLTTPALRGIGSLRAPTRSLH